MPNGGKAGLLNHLPNVEVRDMIKTYVNSMGGSLTWQWNHVQSIGNILET